MPLGNVPSQDSTGKDPLPPGAFKIAAEMNDRAHLVSQRGYYREQLPENDSLREKLKFEIRDDVHHMQGEMPAFFDFQDELSPKSLEILKNIELDLALIDRYLDDDWQEYPFEQLLDDTKALYEELED